MKSIKRTLTRRTALNGLGAGTAGLMFAPGLLRGQAKEIVIGGAASQKPRVEKIVQPLLEKKYNCKIVYEGKRSLVNLEKMQTNKDKPDLSIVQMADPVTILAVKEGLLEKLAPDKVWQGIAYIDF